MASGSYAKHRQRCRGLEPAAALLGSPTERRGVVTGEETLCTVRALNMALIGVQTWK